MAKARISRTRQSFQGLTRLSLQYSWYKTLDQPSGHFYSVFVAVSGLSPHTRVFLYGSPAGIDDQDDAYAMPPSALNAFDDIPHLL
jgi:hypothetical protein